MVSCQSEGAHFPLSAEPHCLGDAGFPVTWPLPPFLCSHTELPACCNSFGEVLCEISEQVGTLKPLEQVGTLKPWVEL